EKERISLGIKQLASDPFESATAGLKKGDVVTCTVTAVTDGGIEVSVTEGFTGFIRKSDLSRDRAEQRPDRFAVGEKIDAKVTQIDRGSRRISLSIKAREMEEEKQAMAEYGSSDSGASLGDILGAALRRKQTTGEE
ncbi:MAG TPA: S1 RNA-binding domain-containing protein, partial [Azospirillum sp.]|nr:S1 RNA-binding domain-containing protein [Azospirillum sp.]